MKFVRSTKEGVTLDLHVQPGATRNAIVGTHGDALKIAVRSQAQEGQANENVVELISETFDTPKRNVQILKGETSRRKLLLITQLTQEKICQILAKHLS